MPDKTFKGKYDVPFDLDNGVYTLIHVARRAGKTDALMNGDITLDHIAKTGDHFEVAYTVRDEAIIKKISNTPMIKCSCSFDSQSSAETVLNEILTGKRQPLPDLYMGIDYANGKDEAILLEKGIP